MTQLTIAEAAEFTNVTTRTLYSHIRTGNIIGYRIPNTTPNKFNSQPFNWVIDKESLEKYYYAVTPGKKQHTRKQTKPQNTKVRWVNVYPNNEIDDYMFTSKKQALENADVDVVMTKSVIINL